MKENVKFLVSGMSCAACVARVDKATRNVKGVKDVNVNLLTNSMVVTYEDDLDESEIIKAVSNAGYKAELVKDKKKILEDEFKDNETPRLIKRLIISVIILMPLFYLAMGYMVPWYIFGLDQYPLVLAFIELTLSLAIMIVNHKFFVSGTKSLLHGGPNMDTLVALGSGVAFIYSFVITGIMIYHIANNGDANHINMLAMNLSYETAGMVPTLITIGKTLESYSKGKTTNAIKGLLDLAPKTATVIRNNEEMVIPVDEVLLDDKFIVKPGEAIPVDGIVIEGNSSIDESMLTGESLPIDKSENDLVKSATINKNGVLICKATHIGEETTINQIIKMVEEASSTKAHISRIADKVSGIFVPTIIGIALIVFLGWFIFGKDFVASHEDIMSSHLSYSIERAIAVLVISCPCALGLATPVAIMVGNGKGAKNGVLFKNAETMEEAGKIDYVVFDKTGTITKGEPEVSDVILINAKSEDDLLSYAYALERNSEHPLSLAITSKAKEINLEQLEVKDFENIPGKGIKGYINKELILGGNAKLLNENDVKLEGIQDQLDKLSNEGKTPLIFAKNKEIIGIIAVSDSLKEDSKEAIEKIKGLGIIPIMLTGDNVRSANYISKEVGIDYVVANVLPEEKYLVIKKLKEQGKVMMVGDGINDAISLTSANVGVAIASGSDIALDSAQVVLMKSTLLDAYASIRLSQQTLLNIKENLFWAFFYNIVMIPIAAGAFSTLGLYKIAPWMGSTAMALSSVFVVLNALRLNLFNPYKDKRKHKKVNVPDLDISCKIGENNMEKVLSVEGMMCMHCVAHVKEALEKVHGVTSAEVSLENKEAKLILSEEVKDEDLIKSVEDAGYKAKIK